MDALEKCRLALRKFLKTSNKEEIKKDLSEMREKSKGQDIDWYVNH